MRNFASDTSNNRDEDKHRHDPISEKEKVNENEVQLKEEESHFRCPRNYSIFPAYFSQSFSYQMRIVKGK
jgi:hypothetical protein